MWIDVTPVSLKKYNQFDQKEYENFNSALDDYYAKITDVERGDEATGDVESEVARHRRILQKQQKALETLKEPIIDMMKTKKIFLQVFI